MKNRVYGIRCPDYENADEKIAELLHMMGGMSQFVKLHEKIVLKPNLLLSVKPEKAVTTHPSIVAAVARLVKKEGADPIIADSPGSALQYTPKNLAKLYETCGMTQAAEATSAVLNFDAAYQSVSFPDGNLIKRFEVISPVLNADGVINLCKLKTHGLMHMTGAVKNSFGVIPGLTKPGYHAKLSDRKLFADMLLDVSEFVSPRLSIMDAVIGMEGNGPFAGTPRSIDLILASMSPLALDVVASEIMGIHFNDNPLLVVAEKRGLRPCRFNQVELIGVDISDIKLADFKFPTTFFKRSNHFILSFFNPLLKYGFNVIPAVIENKCTACGNCCKACPQKVIQIIDKKVAKIERHHCIRCYCCHEMCTQEAIELRRNFVYRLMSRFL